MKQLSIFLILALTVNCTTMKTSIEIEKITYDYPDKQNKKGKKLIKFVKIKYTN